MIIICENCSGYSIYKLKEKQILENVAGSDDVEESVRKLTVALVNNISLETFSRFTSLQEASSEIRALKEGKVGTVLEATMSKVSNDVILTEDVKLAEALSKKFGFTIFEDRQMGREILRFVREKVDHEVANSNSKSNLRMNLGLAHAHARETLAKNQNNIDMLIICAVASFTDIEKQANAQMIQLSEWYGWHFPEAEKIINDRDIFLDFVIKCGKRQADPDLSELNLDSTKSEKLLVSAQASVGSEVSDDDFDKIKSLAIETQAMIAHKNDIAAYLKERMTFVAPNVTMMIGEVIGARLITHAGSLEKLAQCPASTIQLYGAEKALFRALKSRERTPKYGLIYQSTLVGKASAGTKAKIARTLSAKLALAARVDSQGGSNASFATVEMEKLQKKLVVLESVKSKAGNNNSGFRPKRSSPEVTVYKKRKSK